MSGHSSATGYKGQACRAGIGAYQIEGQKPFGHIKYYPYKSPEFRHIESKIPASRISVSYLGQISMLDFSDNVTERNRTNKVAEQYQHYIPCN